MPEADQVVRSARERAVAILTIDSPPVNALSHAVRSGIKSALDAAIADASVAAVVLICAGRTFVAGADITEFGKPMREPGLAAVIGTIEASTKPVVAAIHGTALGGGLELALACHYRVAVAAARLGLPEVKLGILPGAGGTQRLPRVVGVPLALDMISGGEPIGAAVALQHGLVDEVAAGDLRAAAVGFAEKVVREGLPLRRIRDMSDKLKLPEPDFFRNYRATLGKRKRGLEAPQACIDAVEAAVTLPFDEGLKRERELFLKLLGGEQSKAQRYFFFAERDAAKIPDVPADTPVRPIGKAAVIGAGTMGGGIAMNFANAGIPVTVVEADAAALERGLGVVRKNYEISASRGGMESGEIATRMGLIKGSISYDDIADADIVIEAVFEDMALKKDIFARLDRMAKRDAILATNTSTLDVNTIAAATSRPESVIGLHFFSPANVMRLLEIVRGAKTAKPVIATSMALAKTIRKVPALVGVCDGFVGNRMLAQRGREAERLLIEGALPHQVDKVLTDFGFPMGPFAMGDLAGLDVGWRVRQARGTKAPSALRSRAAWAEDRGGLLPLRARQPRAASRSRGRAHHCRRLGEARRRAPADRRARDAGAAALSHDQRRRQDPRRRHRAEAGRYRRHLGLWLWLAGLSRRPHALCRHGRPGADRRAPRRLRAALRRARLGAGAAAAAPRRRSARLRRLAGPGQIRRVTSGSARAKTAAIRRSPKGLGRPAP
jgi:3-hydroxyacyl-CoA dehydrogenase